MNKYRRIKIRNALNLIQEATALIEQAAQDEQESFDNMPDNMQSGDRGQAAEQAASELQDLQSTLEDVVTTIEQADWMEGV